MNVVRCLFNAPVRLSGTLLLLMPVVLARAVQKPKTSSLFRECCEYVVLRRFESQARHTNVLFLFP